MTTADGRNEAVWLDALLAAAVFAVDPIAIGGIRLRAPPGPVRDAWLAELRAMLGAGMALRRVPHGIDDNRLLGGLDLAATLRTGRPVAEQGLLAGSNGDVLLLGMAERMPSATASRIAAVCDTGVVRLRRDGLDETLPTRFGMVALDEGIDDDEAPPGVLLDRLGLFVDLSAIHRVPATQLQVTGDDIRRARALRGGVTLKEGVTESLCAAAVALGVEGLRASMHVCRVAHVLAALHGRVLADEDDGAEAVRLVLLPRATRMPAAESDEDPAEPAPTPPQDESPEQPASAATEEPSSASGESEQRSADDVRPDEEQVLDAARAVMPEGLLQQLRDRAALSGLRQRTPGRGGVQRRAGLRGRPLGTRRGTLASGQRLSLLDTLRAAAPWQRLRRKAVSSDDAGPRVLIRPDDFRLKRFKPRSETTTVFVVDASGSAAMHRLAEAKGAVELLLAECYVRRDRVALIAFRGPGAQVLLAPTRSLVRAKRSLAALPGGGGTPLAAGLDAARDLGEEIVRRGGTPILVVLTDGRANVTRAGIGGREQATLDAEDAARTVRGSGLRALVVDTSPRPRDVARTLASGMGAAYLPLPQANAGAISEAVRVASSHLTATE